AQIVNYLIAQPVDPMADDTAILLSWNGQMGWRWMFWAETVPAVIFFFLVFLIPESPRYLIKAGRSDKAVSILSRIGGAAYATAEKNEIEATMVDHAGKVRLRDLLDKRVVPVVLIGVVLAVFQQWCGINVVFNYAEEVFVAAGFTVSDMLFNIVITGTVNLVFTLVAIRVVDSLGRRKLMLFGSIGLACVYFLMGGGYMLKLDGIVVLILVLLGIATYAMTLAPITWVVLSEIFPNRLRGAAMAVATTALWTASFLLTYTFPLLNKALQAGGTFWLYALICLAGFFFIWKKLPETKGKTLEEIERELTK
ncbi:MAG: sugar porter family MFS transporter, partial [Bacteroidales bacterium]|nr:sugar porter family MFS transporter [Bacteroidales bacterium]